MTAGPVMRGKRGRDRRLAASSAGSSGSGSGAGRRQPDLSALPPLLAAPGAVDGPADESGVRRTKTGWRKVLRREEPE